jgi:hypothetical protein
MVALVVSVVLTVRQIRLARGGNHLPVIMGEFKASRGEKWLPAYEYVMTELAAAHSPECGWRGLPPAARAHVDTVGIFFDDLGKQVAHGMIDQDVVIGSYGMPVVYLWDVLAPYVYEERRARFPNFWSYFEDLAARTAERPPEIVYRKLGLRRRGPGAGPAQVPAEDPGSRRLRAAAASPRTPITGHGRADQAAT